MGCKESTKLKKMLMDWVPSAWQASKYDEGNRHGYAILDDYLVRFKELDTQAGYTLDGLFDRFWEPVARAFMQGRDCRAYVAIADDRSNVTKLKSTEQASRARSTAKHDKKIGLAPATAYPAGTVFHTRGVLLPGEARVIEPICLRRLSKSRAAGLELDLWREFRVRISRRLQSLGDDFDGRLFVLDMEKGGPYTYQRDKDMGVVQCIHRPNMAHNLGESERAFVWWTRFLHTQGKGQTRGMDVHWRTTDTDALAFYACYHLHRPLSSGHVLWQYDKDKMADLGHLMSTVDASSRVHNGGLPRAPPAHAKIEKQFHSLDDFVACFILAGCDFVEKRFLAHGFGWDKIVKAAALASVRRVRETEYAAAETRAIRLNQAMPAIKMSQRCTEILLQLYHCTLFSKNKQSLTGYISINGVRTGCATYNQTKIRLAAETAAKMLAEPVYTADGKVKPPPKPRLLCFPSELEHAWQEKLIDWTHDYWVHARDGNWVAPVLTVPSEVMQARASKSIPEEDEEEEEEEEGVEQA